jgi:hypothetical protein
LSLGLLFLLFTLPPLSNLLQAFMVLQQRLQQWE